MEIFTDALSFKNYTRNLRGKIGFVPTMGALHDGHISLVKRAKVENDFCVASIFVNPTQFLAGEDLEKYPKRTEADIKLCEIAGVDALFLPSANEMYEEDEPFVAAPQVKGYYLEGFVRPRHFDGVLSIVLKLLCISNADNAYFGQKDAQQLILVKQLCERFFMDTNIVACPTVRDKDGLALSSRNAYLSSEDRRVAVCISKALFAAGAMVGKQITDTKEIELKMREQLTALEVEYIAFCDRKLNKIEKIEITNSIILIAARLGHTRLIDNIWI